MTIIESYIKFKENSRCQSSVEDMGVEDEIIVQKKKIIVHFINPCNDKRVICGHDATYGRFQINTTDLEKVTCQACLDRMSNPIIHFINPINKKIVMCGRKVYGQCRNNTEDFSKVTCINCLKNISIKIRADEKIITQKKETKVHFIHPKNNNRVVCGHDKTCERYRNNTTDVKKVTCKPCLDFISDIKTGRKKYFEPKVHFINPRNEKRVICGHDTTRGRFQINTTDLEKVTCQMCLTVKNRQSGRER